MNPPPITRKNSGLTLAAFGCIYFFWGSAFVANRYGVQRVHPAVLAGLRYLIAGSCLLIFACLRGESLRLRRKELLQVSVLGLIMFTCNTILLGYGSRTLAAGTAALVVATIPLFISLLECGQPGGTSLSPFGWLGTITGFLGLGLLCHDSLHASAMKGATAIAFMALILAALAWAIGSVLTRRFALKGSLIVCTAWQMLIGGGVNLLIGAGLRGFHESRFTTMSVAAIAYLAIFGTLAGYLSYAYLLRNVRLTTAATYAYVNPVVAVLLGWLILGEALAKGEWIALMLVLGSVALVVSIRPRRVLARVA